jgi:hypothetical protein
MICPMREHDHLGILFRPTHTLERHFRHQPGFPFGSPDKAGQHRGIDGSGPNDIDARTETPPPQGPPTE